MFHYWFCSGYVFVQLISPEYFCTIHVQALRVSLSQKFPAVLQYKFMYNWIFFAACPKGRNFIFSDEQKVTTDAIKSNAHLISCDKIYHSILAIVIQMHFYEIGFDLPDIILWDLSNKEHKGIVINSGNAKELECYQEVYEH